ncbi:MAG: hypothetical protein ACM3ZB_10160 [bacterium]|jgi:FtsZ-binding cell division protein ZapB
MGNGDFVTRQEFQQFTQELKARQNQVDERIRKLQEAFDSLLARMYDFESRTDFGPEP